MSNAAAPDTDGPDRDRQLPPHVAIIMDGNGRWAAARGLPRGEGHRARRRGVAPHRPRRRRTRHSLSHASSLQLGELVAAGDRRSAISSGLLRRFIRNDLADLHRDNVRVRVIGERDGLDADICALLDEAEELTRDNDGLNLVVAFNYGCACRRSRARRAGSRDEVAAGQARSEHRSMPTRSRQYLDAPDIPDPDLDHPHQRRAAIVELPDVAGGL